MMQLFGQQFGRSSKGQTYDSAILLPDIYPREWKMYVLTNLYSNIYSSIFPNSQNVETTQISIN